MKSEITEYMGFFYVKYLPEAENTSGRKQMMSNFILNGRKITYNKCLESISKGYEISIFFFCFYDEILPMLTK